MSNPRWQRIEDIFQRAVELAPGEQSAMLDEACAGDPSLRGEVESLLAYDSEEGLTFTGPARPVPREAPGTHAKSLSQGDKLGPYEISGLIAAGGMGEVYRARDPRLQRDVAIKVLPAEVSREVSLYQGRRQRFEREARAVAALNHPNIVAIYDVGEDRGVFFIVTELVEGETLRTSGLSVRKALDIAVQIASGLGAAHHAGVVHRDLKPANILLTRDGQVKILDFGLAKVGQSGADAEMETLKTHPGAVLGTPSYMSPEQVKGQQTDHRADIFSFGLIFYEMLAGQRAFQGIAPEAMAAILNNAPPDLLETVPSGVRLTVAHCLEKDPAKRFQSARDLSLALSALSGDTSAPTPAPARPFRWPAAAWIALVAVAIATALTAGGWFWYTPAPPPHATVLTSFVGFQGIPSLSPDGNQFAFAWDGDVPKGPSHVYLSLLGKGPPLRLTPENEGGTAPSWSPDGQWIAFSRSRTASGNAGLFVMPALGGPSRRISTGPAAAVCWSPDGKWLLWSRPDNSARSSVLIAPAGGGEERKLLDPPMSGFGDSEPAVSPDGGEVVWNRCEDLFNCALYLAGFQHGRLTGKPRQITQDYGRKGCPVWTHDGKEILYLGGQGNSELSIYRVRTSGGDSRRIEGSGDNASSLTLAARSNRLLYSTVSINFDIRRANLNAADTKPQRFISSTRYEGDASYSPDGKRIAFSSNRGGVQQIWAADADGGNVSPLTSFPDGVASSPKWSPDGHHIVFDARTGGDVDLYAVPADGGAVRRLTDHAGQNHAPTWSPDGKWIYFFSTRAGPHEIFRIRPDGSGARQMTHNGGYYGLASPDGKWLYYSIPGKGLWKMPADGGEGEQVLPTASLPNPFGFVVKERGIYAVGGRRPEGYPVVLYSIDGEKPQTLIVLGSLPRKFPEVSPDGRWLLYTAADDPTYEIMLVDNFR